MDRRSVIIGAGLAAAAGFSYFNAPRAMAAPIPNAQFEKMIPGSVGAWRSRKSAELVLPPEDKGRDKLYQNLETRIYEAANLPSMMMLIAYNNVQQNDIQVHRPEVCYPASGFPIDWSRGAMIDFGNRKVSATELVADRGGLKEHILYWVRVGDKFPVGLVDLRLASAISNAKGVIPDGLLFRISTIAESDTFSSDVLTDFAKAFVAAASPRLKKTMLF